MADRVVHEGGPGAGAPVVVAVRGLSVTFAARHTPPVHALRGLDLDIRAGEILGLVGESGSGKSVLGACILGLLPERPTPLVTGSVMVKGTDMLTSPESSRRLVRRLDLGAVFQDPMSSLNPTMRIGQQVVESCGSEEEAIRLLGLAGIPDAASRLRSFPHELSGGLRQRVMIAAAVAGNPALIVADEPTTALDVTVQAQILTLLRHLLDEFGCSVLMVTHDLGVAAQVSDRIAVLYGGRLAELGPTHAVLTSPRHPYSAALLQSRISLGSDPHRPLPTIEGEPPSPTQPSTGCPFSPRCALHAADCDVRPPDAVIQSDDAERRVACLHTDQILTLTTRPEPAAWAIPAHEDRPPVVSVRNARKEYRVRGGQRSDRIVALDGVDLDVRPGESVAVVGESGSGKSTLLRAIAGLTVLDTGTVTQIGPGRPQVVFQDAGASLTPWLSVGSLLAERLQGQGLSRQGQRERVERVLREVGLDPDVARFKPARLSGGQRQRVAMARAVIVPPPVLLCDEPTSALDASRAAAVLNEITRLRGELHMSLLFVTHDLGAAHFVADRIAVMYMGRIVEIGPARQIVTAPSHPYTRSLLDSVPELERPLAPPTGEAPNPVQLPSGCRFRTRCPIVQDLCASRPAHLVGVGAAHLVDCIVFEPQRSGT